MGNQRRTIYELRHTKQSGSLTRAHSITKLIVGSTFLALVRSISITAIARFVAFQAFIRSLAIDAEFVGLGASVGVDAFIHI